MSDYDSNFEDHQLDFPPKTSGKRKKFAEIFYSSDEEREASDFSLAADQDNRLDFNDSDDEEMRVYVGEGSASENNSSDETCRSANLSAINSDDDRPDQILSIPKVYSDISKLLSNKVISFVDKRRKMPEAFERGAKRLESLLNSFKFSYRYYSDQGELIGRRFNPTQAKIMRDFKLNHCSLNYSWLTPDQDVFLHSKSDIRVFVEVKVSFLFEDILSELASHLINKLERADTLQNYAYEEKLKDKQLIIKLSECPNKFIIKCDENIENSVEFNRIRLISNYGRLCSKLFYVGHYIIFWATDKKLFEMSILSLDDLLMMVIFLFQIERLVPVLQSQEAFQPDSEVLLKFTRKRAVKRLETTAAGKSEFVPRTVRICTWFQEEHKLTEAQKGQNRSSYSPGVLLAKFFHFYSRSLPFLTRVISISTGTLKATLSQNTNVFQIEDPFVERKVHRVGIKHEKYLLDCLTKSYKAIMVDQKFQSI